MGAPSARIPVLTEEVEPSPRSVPHIDTVEPSPRSHLRPRRTNSTTEQHIRPGSFSPRSSPTAPTPVSVSAAAGAPEQASGLAAGLLVGVVVDSGEQQRGSGGQSAPCDEWRGGGECQQEGVQECGQGDGAAALPPSPMSYSLRPHNSGSFSGSFSAGSRRVRPMGGVRRVCDVLHESLARGLGEMMVYVGEGGGRGGIVCFPLSVVITVQPAQMSTGISSRVY